ncbi:MAG: outer membrane protein assembly factor BamD [Woeseiaceae bacterium]|nr:outer membrane protein assembly factor BamD [Woeseiaceae bacterium]
MNNALDTRISRLPALLRAGLLAAVLTLGAGCAGNEEQDTVISDITDAYTTAKNAVARGNYGRGIEIFEAIQARYPFSELSRQLQLDLMYAYYKAGRVEEAVETADTFMRENPIHESVDYALYIKGLAYFEDEAGFLEQRFKKDVTERPPENVEESYSSFRRLVERYPASQYAPDAEQRMVFLKNRLADYENHVARYYLRRGAYIASLNRAKNALEEYNGAPANSESLRIMERAYEKLGMFDLAADARRVRELNFPNES